LPSGLAFATCLSSPIVVCGLAESGDRCIAGNHRVEACRQLGHADIPVRVVDGLTIECELIEIDENLCRAELTAAQRATHIKRRKEIWAALNPEPRVAPWEREEDETEVELDVPLQSGAKSFKGPLGGARPHKKDFAASTAELTGQSKQHINRQLAIPQA
jgi:hypothetical protein